MMSKYARPRAARKHGAGAAVAVLATIAAGSVVPTATAANAADYSARINVGGSNLVDEAGTAWSPDAGFLGGGVHRGGAISINGTERDGLYQKHRWGMTGYQLPVPEAGTYRVSLNFAEIVFSQAGRRVFDVSLEGQKRLDRLDVFARVGGNTALVQTFDVPVADGTLDIAFGRVVEDPMVSAIEVTKTGPAATPAPTPAPTTSTPSTPAAQATRVSAGGGSWTDSTGRRWTADTGYLGGAVAASGAVPITGTNAAPLYRKHRWGARGYRLPVTAAGTYRVSLHFAETVFTSRGRRVFDVSLENQLKLDDLDVFAASGRNAALVRTFDVPVTDGALDLAFGAVVEDPMISAIEVVPVGSAPAPVAPAPVAPAPTAPAPTAPAPTAPPAPPAPAPAPPAPPAPAPAPPAPAPVNPAPTTGFPGAGTTGVPAGTALRPSGSITVTQDGTVLDGLDVAGSILVRANNVTIRRTKAMSINTGGNVGDGRNYSGTLIEDVTIDGRGSETMGIDGLNFTARRVDISRTKNGFRLFSNTTVEGSWVHDLFASPGDHVSGIGSNGGSNLTVRGNNIDCGTVGQCSGALVLYPQPSQSNVLVERNLLNGGGYCTYPPDHDATNVRYVNNEFGRKNFATCGYYGARFLPLPGGNGNVWSGNVWQDTRQPV